MRVVKYQTAHAVGYQEARVALREFLEEFAASCQAEIDSSECPAKKVAANHGALDFVKDAMAQLQLEG